MAALQHWITGSPICVVGRPSCGRTRLRCSHRENCVFYMNVSTGRIAGLDGLRALSVLAVFAHHTGLTTVHGGFVGVDMFFVLSGFLITRLLSVEYEQHGRISFTSFYIRRARRLYPALILFLTMVAVYCFVLRPEVHLAWEIGASLSYIMNWVRAFGVYDATMTGHTWSLAIEEQFYLVWPLMVLGLLRMRAAKPLVVVGMAVVAVAGWRLYLEAKGVSAARIYCGFDTHSDGLLIGAFIALAPSLAVRQIARFWKIAAVFLVTSALSKAFADFASSGIGFLLVGLSSGVIIAKIVTDQGSVLVGFLNDRILVGLGVVSYGFYLWHYAVIRVFLYSGYDHFGAFFGSFDYPRLIMFAVCLVGTLIPTLLSWYFIEAPLLKKSNFSLRFISRIDPCLLRKVGRRKSC